jgi:hypothetical protein
MEKKNGLLLNKTAKHDTALTKAWDSGWPYERKPRDPSISLKTFEL